MGFTKTVYKPKNKDKYIGKEYPICRSSWERIFCKYLDDHTKVVKWDSEPLPISYIDKSYYGGKKRNYYPDFFVELTDGRKMIIEIKPEHETKEPTKAGKKKKTYVTQKVNYIRNMSKWEAATKWCNKRGLEFKILTESQCGFK